MQSAEYLQLLDLAALKVFIDWKTEQEKSIGYYVKVGCRGTGFPSVPP
jgi:hypothetical protein